MADEPLEEKDVVEEEAESEAPKKKGGLIKILFFIVLLAVVLIGGWFFGQWFFFSGNNPDGEESADVTPQREVVEQFDRENPPGTLEFNEPFLIKLQRQEGLLRSETYLKVNLTLEVKDVQTQEEMSDSSAIMSRISDTVISFFSSKYPEKIEPSNWPQLKRELMDLINSEFPEEYHILRVNWKEFIQQQK